MAKEFNEEYLMDFYKVKKQSLTLEEFLEFRNWVCSRLIDEDEMEIKYDMAGIFMQFAFAKFYLQVELPNIDTENELDDYELICMIDPGDYAEYINWNQYTQLDLSIERYLAKINKIYQNAKEYKVNDFLKDIVLTLNSFSLGFLDKINFDALDFNELISSMEKFTSLTNGQVDARDLAKNVLDQTKTNKTNKRSIAKTTKPKEDKKDVN